MAKIEIYSKNLCPYCERAKLLLKRKGLDFSEYLVDQAPEKFAELLERAPGKRSLPQIFINDQYIGGSDDLYALESAGKLDKLLSKDSILNKSNEDDD